MNLIPDNWQRPGQLAMKTIGAYLTTLVMLRLAGKRALSTADPFTLILLVTFGSVIGIAIISDTISFIEGMIVIAVMIAITVIISSAIVRWPSLERIVEGEPTLLYHKTKFLTDAMKKERITADELISQIREAGHADFQCVDSAVLETNGHISVLTKPECLIPPNIGHVQIA